MMPRDGETGVSEAEMIKALAINNAVAKILPLLERLHANGMGMPGFIVSMAPRTELTITLCREAEFDSDLFLSAVELELEALGFDIFDTAAYRRQELYGVAVSVRL